MNGPRAPRGSPARARARRGGPLRRLAAASLLALAAVLAAPALPGLGGLAHGAVLLSTVGQSDDGHRSVYKDRDIAQGFVAGGNEAGYYVDSIEVTVDEPASSATRIAGFIYSEQSNKPHQELKALTFNASDSSGSLYLFEVDGSTLILEKNKRYFVVFTSTLNSGDWDLDTSNSDGQDSSTTGWSMDNTSLESTDDGSSWSGGDNGRVLRMRVNGDPRGYVLRLQMVGSVSGGTGGYRAGDDIKVGVHFSEAIDLGANSTPPQLRLDVGGTTRTASCVHVATTSLLCTYRVQAGEFDLDGVKSSGPG